MFYFRLFARSVQNIIELNIGGSTGIVNPSNMQQVEHDKQNSVFPTDYFTQRLPCNLTH